ncbi:MAG TPA: SDR family oxidoreductase [Burkholderiaceae bacterium]|nr:SDR family oxidoreductase [Burkholderiaceae bacterium]
MTTHPFDFTGRTVFVAGGSSGINLGIADAFARHGASVAIVSRSQERIAAALARLRRHVDMLTRTLAMEWGGDGIRVNSIVPGPIEGTEGIRRLAPNDAERARMLERVPLRRYGSLDANGDPVARARGTLRYRDRL